VLTRIHALLILRVCIALLAFLLALFFAWQQPDFAVRLDEGLRDGFTRLTASEQAEERLVVVDINEAGLREFGAWPWPRQQVADLVEILLGTYGARAVGLDIVFPEAGNSPGDAAGDARLAALAQHAPLTLAQILDYTPRSPALLQGQLSGGLPPPPLSGQTAAAIPMHVTAYGFIANHAGLAGARCVGNIGYLPDADGILRRIPVRTHYAGRDFAPFASALMACAGETVPALQGNAAGLWRVPYRRALTAYTVIGVVDVLQARVPRDMLAGRYVLVGSSALGLGDRVSTPLAPLSSGVMVHAESLSDLLDLADGQLGSPRPGLLGLLAWCAVSITLATLFIPRFSAWGGVLLLGGLVLAWLALAFWGVTRQVEWSITAPLWAYFFLLAVAVPHEWWQTQRKSRRLMNTLAHYVAQPVLDEIVRLDLQHSLTPTLREVTVLIADMEGYTQTTSRLSLTDTATLTKDFLDCLTRPVLALHGTLDKYTGDGLVAFWGAPLDCPDQADRAVSAALAIQAAVADFNAQRAALGFTPVRVRVGIESGRALVGDLGTSFRSTYTAVGDCINFASRLEAAARDLPSSLIIGSAANTRLKKHRTRSLGRITLRGTQTSIEVFTVA
jgi:adenylate cyclase